MHPILGKPKRLALYLLAWVPLTKLLAYLMAAQGGLSSLEITVLIVPLALLYAFVCLSTWYSCRAVPLETISFVGVISPDALGGKSSPQAAIREATGLLRVVLPNILAALIVSFLWVLAAKGLAAELSTFTKFQGLNQRFEKDLPLVFGVGVLLYLLSVAMHYTILAQEASREAEQRVLQAHVQARDAELRALKAQVNPHFLFNSLHSISALTSSDPARAREMCIALADFLRRTLGLGEKSVISLEEELSLIHSFLAVEKIRFGARLEMEENIEPETLGCMVPPLLLQPLVENAVAHGIANLTEGGWIHLNANYRAADESISILVENSFDPEAPARRRNGVGLVNVRQRLETRYGNRSSFSVNKNDERFQVGLILPAERKAVTA